MRFEKMPQGAQDAVERLHAAIAAEGPHLGPQSAMSHDMFDDDQDPDCPVPAVAMLGEWEVVAAWIDDTGQTWLTRMTSPRMAEYRIAGLLAEITE